MASPASSPARTDLARDRLLEGMAAAVSERGYAATTIADVVRHARVSKRTFYEHFPDKESCFLAAYEAASLRMLGVWADAASAPVAWAQRIRAAARAYLSALAAQPELTRTFSMEIQAAGPRALALRRQLHGRAADQLRALVDEVRADHPELRALSPTMATAIVGAITELVLLAVDEGRTQELAELDATAAELVRAVLVAPEG